MRTLAELLDSAEPALPLLRDWIDDPAGNSANLIPPSEAVRADTLVGLQVTTRSMLGALAYETGGVSIAEGLVRLLGSGSRHSIIQAAEAAGCPLDGHYPDIIVVADDAFGGLFAVNGGRLGSEKRGEVFHLAADDIIWVALGVGYSDFVHWCLTGDLSVLYSPLMYLDVFEARPLPAFEATFSFYPFLWTKEAKERQPSVRLIDADESLKFRLDLCGFAVG